MYAVIETGGKQYRVELGTELAVERLAVNPGDAVEFDRVLLVADGDSTRIGTPTVAQATVTAHVVRQDRAKKVVVFKYRPKARHRAKKGHRQEQTVLRVEDIQLDGRSAAQEAGTQAEEQAKAQRAAAAEAKRKAAADQALAEKLASAAEPEATEVEPAPKTRKRASKAAAEPATTEPAATETEAAAAKPATKSKSSARAKSAEKTKAPRTTRGTKSTKKDS